MSLYIKLWDSFWTHRKTSKLRTLIGDEAFWIMPRLWCYALSHQPDGDFTSYSEKELCLVLECPKQSGKLLKALRESGYMKGGKLNNWSKYYADHTKFTKRAKTAARARWNRRGGTR